MKYEFPKGFLWGAATSAHQVEGNTHNDWTEWEKNNASRLAKESRGRFGHLPNWKEVEKEATNPQNYISGIACDHYNRYKEDFDLAKSLGHNAHRFSIEWSRIEPEEGKFDEVAIAHYRDVVETLRERGLEPFVTLWHWTIPLWLRDKGGILAQDFPDYFARYAEKVVTVLKNDVTFWVTLNEPLSVIKNSYLLGNWPPQRTNPFAVWQTYKTLAKAHNLGYETIKKIMPSSKVGLANIINFFEPDNPHSIFDKFIVKIADYFHNRRILDLTQGKNDFIALQYYFHDRLKFPVGRTNNNDTVSDLGWEIYPEGLCYIIKKLAVYKLPIYITENGISDKKDFRREKFIKENLKQISRAMSEGADVRGYFYWSLLDNFEWDKGFWPRFGLVEIDYETLERKPRPSAYAYKKIIEDNGIVD